MTAETEGRRAYLAALRMLGRRALSVQEVTHRLEHRGFGRQAVAEAVAELQGEGVLDDAAYARAYVHDRLLFHPIGRRGLQVELQRRGVPPAVVQEALLQVSVEREEELIRSLLARRRPSKEEAASCAESRRLRRWLVQRGFSAEAIRRVLGGGLSFAEDGPQG
ncbi:MAG: regulatory protein RecX [Betaproteobacteria bacterium]